MLETLPRTTSLWQLLVSTDLLLTEYAAYLQTAGYSTSTPARLRGARQFLERYPDLDRWRGAPLEEQLRLSGPLKAFAHYLFLKLYLRPTMSYLLTARPRLAPVGKRDLYAQIYAQFHELSHRLGYADKVLRGTLTFLVYVLVYTGKPLTELTASDLQAFDQAMRACPSFSPRIDSPHLYRVRLLLFQAGYLPSPPQRYNASPAAPWLARWATLPEPIREVVERYLDQVRLVRAPQTVKKIEGYLHCFFSWLAQAHPGAQQVPAITRSHIEAFKLWLHDTPTTTGKPYQAHTIASALGALRAFFRALQEWNWPEAPNRPLVFTSDLPLPDHPLPRFLEDAQAAALLSAARASEDLFTRICVETLLRTGLRKGEFVRLQVDSVVQLGDTFWLRVPLGKLHTDRYVPLHPQVKRLLDEWMAQRAEAPRSTELFIEHGRRVSIGRVDEAVRRAARAAGLPDPVSPHRLRHTLATQAINRGMSLEAIAALLGHRSLNMTLTYARIANATVQAQYASVSDSLDSLYAQAALGDQARSARESQGMPPA